MDPRHDRPDRLEVGAVDEKLLLHPGAGRVLAHLRDEQLHMDARRPAGGGDGRRSRSSACPMALPTTLT